MSFGGAASNWIGPKRTASVPRRKRPNTQPISRGARRNSQDNRRLTRERSKKGLVNSAPHSKRNGRSKLARPPSRQPRVNSRRAGRHSQMQRRPSLPSVRRFSETEASSRKDGRNFRTAALSSTASRSESNSRLLNRKCEKRPCPSGRPRSRSAQENSRRPEAKLHLRRKPRSGRIASSRPARLPCRKQRGTSPRLKEH